MKEMERKLILYCSQENYMYVKSPGVNLNSKENLILKQAIYDKLD